MATWLIRCRSVDFPCVVYTQRDRVGTIIGSSIGVEALLVDWDGLRDSKIATAKVDCGGPIRDEMIHRGSLKWVNCGEIEVLPNALPDRNKDEL